MTTLELVYPEKNQRIYFAEIHTKKKNEAISLTRRITKNINIYFHIIYQFSSVAQLCPTLCDPMDYNLPGSSVHAILQARILEWGAIPFSRGPSQPRDQTQVSCIAGRLFAVWATREDQEYWSG